MWAAGSHHCLFDFFQTAYVEYWKVKLNGTGRIPSDKEAWLRPLIDGSFFAAQPRYRNDVLLSSANHGSVSASRFYVIGRRADPEASAEEGLMLGVRELASGSEPSVIPYCPEFIYYERYLSVKKDTLLPIGVTIIGWCELQTFVINVRGSDGQYCFRH